MEVCWEVEQRILILHGKKYYLSLFTEESRKNSVSVLFRNMDRINARRVENGCFWEMKIKE